MEEYIIQLSLLSLPFSYLSFFLFFFFFEIYSRLYYLIVPCDRRSLLLFNLTNNEIDGGYI